MARAAMVMPLRRWECELARNSGAGGLTPYCKSYTAGGRRHTAILDAENPFARWTKAPSVILSAGAFRERRCMNPETCVANHGWPTIKTRAPDRGNGPALSLL